MPCEHNQPEHMQYDPGLNDLGRKFAAKFANTEKQIIPMEAINALSDIRAMSAFIQRQKDNIYIEHQCSERSAIENGLSSDYDARAIMDILELYFAQQ